MTKYSLAGSGRFSQGFGRPLVAAVPLACLCAAWMSASPWAAFGKEIGTGKTVSAVGRPGEKRTQRSCEQWAAEEVPYIIVADEKAQAARIRTDRECEQFIKEFWERRNPNPGSGENKFKEQYYKRVAYAKEHFRYRSQGPRDDRARIYIWYGPPDKIERPQVSTEGPPNKGQSAPPVRERWIYNFIDGLGENVQVEFTDPEGKGEYRVVVDPESLRRPTAG